MTLSDFWNTTSALLVITRLFIYLLHLLNNYPEVLKFKYRIDFFKLFKHFFLILLLVISFFVYFCLFI